jgi:Hypothetical glycosyl hydrolase 6/Beta-galactosidase trimerisation domain
MTSREQYSWLQQSRTLLIDAYWPPLNPTLEFDAEKLIQTAKNVNANAIRFGTIGKYALIQNDFIPLHPDLGGRDLLAETIEAAKGTDIKIIAYSSVGHGLPRSLLLEQRPQWGLLMDDGDIQDGVRHFGGELVAPVCSFGQYRDDILNFISHVVDNYKIDSLYLDGPYYNWNMGTQKAICQCAVCKQVFLKETGFELPTNKNFDDSELHEVFADWVGRRLYELLHEIIVIAKRTKNLPVMFNVFAASARTGKWEQKMIEATDGFLLEAELGGLRGLGVGDYHDKIIWRYTQDHTAWPRCSTSYAEQQNKHSGFETLVWGGAPIISYGGRLCLDNSCQKPVAELFDFMKDNEALLDNVRNSKFIGIISEQRISSITESAKKALAGAYKLFQSAGLQTGIVTNEALRNIDTLQQYPVLFLPGDVCINEAEAECLREYVRSGGNLIASGKASFYNDDFLLKDVFKVSLQKSPVALESLQFWNGLWDVYLQQKNSKKLLPVKELTWIKEGENTQCLAEIVVGTDSEYLASAIIKNNFGKGTCCYINFPIGRVYDELEEPEFVKIIESVIDAAKSPCKINCDHRLYSSLKEKENLKVLYLCNPSAETRIFTVDIELKANAVPNKVYSLTSGENIEHENKNGQIILKEYSFKDFECIAIKFQNRNIKELKNE